MSGYHHYLHYKASCSISDIHKDLTDLGFFEDASWKLIPQIFNHIFTDDMGMSRRFFRKAMDTHYREEMAVAVS